MNGVDLIILIIVLVLLGFALRGAVRHFRGEGPCCGGSGRPAERPSDKHLDGPVIGQRTLHISGMHCANCANHVTGALNAVEGAVAKVDLNRGTAVVRFDRTVDDIELRRAVKQAGYHVDYIEAG